MAGADCFGIDHLIEISPLFETAEALERGQRVHGGGAALAALPRLSAAGVGRLCLQFGYSDSGRYVGQLAASYLIERLRLKIAETLKRHGVTGVDVVLFDTHGESIGRGAHPNSLDRPAEIPCTRPSPAAPWPRAGVPRA